MINNCKWLYANWCHNPKLCARDGQELCPLHMKDMSGCEEFEQNSKEVQDE